MIGSIVMARALIQKYVLVGSRKRLGLSARSISRRLPGLVASAFGLPGAYRTPNLCLVAHRLLGSALFHVRLLVSSVIHFVDYV
jgi:hypothetical protein